MIAEQLSTMINLMRVNVPRAWKGESLTMRFSEIRLNCFNRVFNDDMVEGLLVNAHLISLHANRPTTHAEYSLRIVLYNAQVL